MMNQQLKDYLQKKESQPNQSFIQPETNLQNLLKAHITLIGQLTLFIIWKKELETFHKREF